MMDSWAISLSSLELGGYGGGSYLVMQQAPPSETKTDRHVMPNSL